MENKGNARSFFFANYIYTNFAPLYRYVMLYFVFKQINMSYAITSFNRHVTVTFETKSHFLLQFTITQMKYYIIYLEENANNYDFNYLIHVY